MFYYSIIITLMINIYVKHVVTVSQNAAHVNINGWSVVALH